MTSSNKYGILNIIQVSYQCLNINGLASNEVLKLIMMVSQLFDLSTNGYVLKSFILAKQATQVLYVEDPKDSRTYIVMHSEQDILGVDNVVDEEEYAQLGELPSFSIGIKSSSDDVDDTTYLRSNHDEGLYIS